jgi:hypothetical protein
MEEKRLKKLLIGDLSIKRIIRSIIFVLFCVIVFTCSCADRLIFHPPESSYTDADDIIKIETANGEKISAMYLQNPTAEFTILFSHGNAEDIGQNRIFFEMLDDHGYSVLAYDYRGYGTSQGRPSEKKTYRDIEAAYQYLTEQLQTEPNRIIPLGRSIGSGPAVYLATKKDVPALILESPLTSAFRVVTRVGILPFDRFENIDRIANIDCPILIFHGTDDSIIPLRHGKTLYEKANDPKQHLWVEGADHNNLLWVAGEEYFEALEKFITLINQQNSQ